MTEPEPAEAEADRSWIGYALGNAAGAVTTAINGLRWVAAIFSVLAIICLIQFVRDMRR